MKSSLYIILDVSGSMNEMGKIHLQRNLCRFAKQLQIIEKEKYRDTDIYLYQWAQSVSEITTLSNGDVPLLDAKGSSSLEVLSDFLTKKLNIIDDPKILILSDGNFSNSEILNFKNQLNTLPNLIIRTIAVGADADINQLRKISSDNNVHLSENISTAIDCAIFGNDDQVIAPEFPVRILQTVSDKTEGGRDV